MKILDFVLMGSVVASIMVGGLYIALDQPSSEDVTSSIRVNKKLIDAWPYAPSEDVSAESIDGATWVIVVDEDNVALTIAVLDTLILTSGNFEDCKYRVGIVLGDSSLEVAPTCQTKRLIDALKGPRSHHTASIGDALFRSLRMLRNDAKNNGRRDRIGVLSLMTPSKADSAETFLRRSAVLEAVEATPVGLVATTENDPKDHPFYLPGYTSVSGATRHNVEHVTLVLNELDAPLGEI